MKSGCWVIERRNKESGRWKFYLAYSDKQSAESQCIYLAMSWGMGVRVRRYERAE